MPTFIKRKCVMAQQKNREVPTYPDWTDEELTEMRTTLPSRFITVPESHAAGVIRPQEKYQEVQDVSVVAGGKTLKSEVKAVPKRKRRATKGRGTGSVRTPRVEQSDSSAVPAANGTSKDG